MTDIIIIGGGTAGLTAAIYAARAHKSVKVCESGAYGGQITHSPRVENYPGFTAISGNEFADKLVEQALILGVDASFCRVERVDKADGAFVVHTSDGDLNAKTVILATGAKPRLLGLAKEEQLVGEGVSYCAVCDGAFYRGQDVAVVGGGNAALQEAIYLSQGCNSVTLIHRRNEFRADAALVARARAASNIRFATETKVSELLGESSLTGIVLESAVSGERSLLKVGGLFVAVGHVADNASYAHLVRLDADGFIDAGEDCRTSVDGVFAAGDCRRKTVRQLTTAAADGAVAGTLAAQMV